MNRRKVKLAKIRVEIVRPECTGCELCTTTCADLFEMAADGFCTLKGGKKVGENDELEIDNEGCAKDAAADCPANCIHVFVDGDKVL